MRPGEIDMRRFFCLLAVLMAAVVTAGNFSPAAAQEIFVDPSVSIPNDFIFTVDIGIDCAGQAVKGVEVILAFDSSLLHLDAITPGPWYTGTGVDFFFYDYSNVDPAGTIHLASSILDGSNDQSLTIAVCHFTAYGFGSTQVIFQDVDVRDPDNMDLGFGHSTGDLIQIDPAVPATATTFGGVKVLFR